MTNGTRNSRSTLRATMPRRARGFTLIELLVALIAGMLVAATAFAFSKASTRFFSQEARIASAQMSVITGFQRLQADLARASYMASPNIVRDKDFGRVCAPDYDNWPADIKKLAGIQVKVGGSSTGTTKLPDGNYPDSVRLFGSFGATDMFPVNLVLTNPSNDGSTVYLATNNGPMSRAGVTDAASLALVFKPGRILRILDLQGKQEYGVINATAFSETTGEATVSTSQILPIKGDDSPTCGIGGNGTGTQASVLSIIEYGIANLKGLGGNADVYAKTIYSEAGSALGDESRTELVRREYLIDPPDPAPPAPPAVKPPAEFWKDTAAEIVAEYAVDLRFALWTGSSASPGMTYVPPSSKGTQGVEGIMVVNDAYTPGTTPTGPESVRAVEVRLVVRSREVDRAADLDPALTNISVDGGYIFRYTLPDNAGVSRARTLVANIALQNQRGDSW